MSETPLHDWLAPRLTALLRDAAAAGFGRDAFVAVLTDMLNRPGLNNAAPDPASADAADPGQPKPAGEGTELGGPEGLPAMPRRATQHLRRGSRW